MRQKQRIIAKIWTVIIAAIAAVAMVIPVFAAGGQGAHQTRMVKSQKCKSIALQRSGTDFQRSIAIYLSVLRH